MAWYDALIEPALNAAGTIYAANQAQDAQQNIANQQVAAGQQAAEMAAFRPVGVTTRFGKSGFQYDDQGRLVGAGYQVAPDIAAQREALLGLSGGALSQAQAAQGFMPQYQAASQSLFGLGQQFLPTSTAYSASPEATQYANFLRQQAAAAAPAGFSATATPEAQALYNQLSGTAAQVMPTSYDTRAAAERYMQQQQGLLAPQREQQLAQIRNSLFQTGRQGLATGATAAGSRAATNPEMAAYYNAIAQQDAALAAGAEQQARTNLQSDINLASQLGTTGLGQLSQSRQQQLSNALQLGQFASGQMGSALQAQQAAEEIARQRMLSNIQTGQGLFGAAGQLLGTGYGLQQSALAPYTSYISGAETIEGLGQQPLTLGRTFGSSAAAAGAQGGSLLTAAQKAAMVPQLTGAGYQAAATQGAIQGLQDPIAKLIGSLTTPPSLTDTAYTGYGMGWGNYDTSVLPAGWRN